MLNRQIFTELTPDILATLMLASLRISQGYTRSLNAERSTILAARDLYAYFQADYFQNDYFQVGYF